MSIISCPDLPHLHGQILKLEVNDVLDAQHTTRQVSCNVPDWPVERSLFHKVDANRFSDSIFLYQLHGTIRFELLDSVPGRLVALSSWDKTPC